MTVKQKVIINDVGSAFLEEALGQMNASYVRKSAGQADIVSAAAATNFYLTAAISPVPGVWLQDVLIAFDFGAATTIASANSYFRVQNVATGNWGGTNLVNRTDFSGTAITGEQLLSINDLPAVTATGTLPMWIAAPNQVRLSVYHDEGANRLIEVYYIIRTTEYEILSTPRYTNALRGFFVK